MKPLTRLLTLRVDLWEVLLVLALLGAIAYPRLQDKPGTITDIEIDRFARSYGPRHSTEHEEEWMIRDFFQDRRSGFFVDIGANHHQLYSKTWYLETRLGWSGIAVDALREFAPGYTTHRPRTRFFAFYVSERSDEEVRMHVISKNTTVASADRSFVAQFGVPDRTETVRTISLNDLLDAEGVTRLDFLTIDIELHEPQALAGFDIARFRPSLVCIEALLPVRQQILDYFARNQYVIDGRYLRADRENLYFRPLAEPSTPTQP